MSKSDYKRYKFYKFISYWLADNVSVERNHRRYFWYCGDFVLARHRTLLSS